MATGALRRQVVWVAVMAITMLCLIGNGAVLAQSSYGAIRVEGNQRIDDSTVLTYAGIEQGQRVTTGQINDAKQRILGSGLFEAVEIEAGRNTLTFIVTEFPTINQISIEGNRRLNDDILQALLSSQPRRVYSPTIAAADARAITDAYFQAGRFAATVTPKIIPRSQNRVDLVFEVTEGAVVEVERISFVGNRSYSDRRLRQALSTKQAGLFRQLVRRDTYIDDRIQFDRQVLTDFYRSRGFVDFRVLSVTPEFSRERDAFFLTFNVEEGQKFKIGTVDLSTDVPGLDLALFDRAIKIRKGQTYSPARLDDTIARLERRAIEEGIDFIRADPVIDRDDANLTLNLTFNLTRGPRIFVERIDIEGNSTTLDRVIRSQFRIVEGDPFNPREIRESAERIRALGFFTLADVNAREGTAPDRVIVDVNVEEQPTGSLQLGANFSLEDGVGLVFGLSERNFLGRGQQLDFSIAGGVDNVDSQLRFIEPALLGRNVTGVFDIYYQATEQYSAFFNTTSLGFEPSISFPISDNGRLELNYRLSDDDVSQVSDESSIIIQNEAGALTTSALGYAYNFNSRRTSLDPNTRYGFEFRQNFAGLGGQTNFVETIVTADYGTKVFNEDIGLTANFIGQALNFFDGSSRVIDRYRGGGTVRGFKRNGLGPRDTTAINEDALGGNFAFGVSLEADFPLGLPEEYGIRGGFFYDFGSIWGLDITQGTNGTVDDAFHLRQVIGATVFWETPIGPLRFDFTRAIEKEDYDEVRNFNFTVSTRF